MKNLCLVIPFEVTLSKSKATLYICISIMPFPASPSLSATSDKSSNACDPAELA